MNTSPQDDHWTAEEVPLPVMHAVQAADAIRQAAYGMQRMQRARGGPERLDMSSVATVGSAFEELTRWLGQFAGQVARSLPDTIEEDPAASREIHDGLVAFRIAILDANVAARALGLSASATEIGRIPPQRRG